MSMLDPAGKCPPLRTARLVLEPLAVRHAEALFGILADPALWQHTNDRPPASEAALRERYARLIGRRSPDGHQLWLNWVPVHRQHGALGFVQATVAGPSSSAEIGYALGRRFWLQGFAFEAVAAMVEHLRRCAVNEFRATVDERNAASIGLLQKLGFTAVDQRDPRNLRFALPR